MRTRPIECFFDAPQYANDFVMQAPIPRGSVACYDVYNDEGECRIVFDIPERRSVIEDFIAYCKKAEGCFDYGEI